MSIIQTYVGSRDLKITRVEGLGLGGKGELYKIIEIAHVGPYNGHDPNW